MPITAFLAAFSTDGKWDREPFKGRVHTDVEYQVSARAQAAYRNNARIWVYWPYVGEVEQKKSKGAVDKICDDLKEIKKTEWHARWLTRVFTTPPMPTATDLQEFNSVVLYAERLYAK